MAFHNEPFPLMHMLSLWDTEGRWKEKKYLKYFDLHLLPYMFVCSQVSLNLFSSYHNSRREAWSYCGWGLCGVVGGGVPSSPQGGWRLTTQHSCGLPTWKNKEIGDIMAEIDRTSHKCCKDKIWSFFHLKKINVMVRYIMSNSYTIAYSLPK